MAARSRLPDRRPPAAAFGGGPGGPPGLAGGTRRVSGTARRPTSGQTAYREAAVPAAASSRAVRARRRVAVPVVCRAAPAEPRWVRRSAGRTGGAQAARRLAQRDERRVEADEDARDRERRIPLGRGRGRREQRRELPARVGRGDHGDRRLQRHRSRRRRSRSSRRTSPTARSTTSSVVAASVAAASVAAGAAARRRPGCQRHVERIATWVAANFESRTVDGVTIYDLTTTTSTSNAT